MMSTSSLEKILLERQLVTPQQIDLARQYIQEQPPTAQVDLLSALTELGFLAQELRQELEQVLAAETPTTVEDPVLQILLEEKYLQEEDLQKALELKRLSDIPIREGTAILEIGATTQEIILQAMKQYYQQHTNATPPPKPYEVQKQNFSQYHSLLGQILIELGFINATQLQKALNYQYHLPRSLYQPLGEILISLDFLTPEQLEIGLNRQSQMNRDPVVQALLDQGILEDWQISYARSLWNNLEYQGLSLRETLLKLGYINQEHLQSLL